MNVWGEFGDDWVEDAEGRLVEGEFEIVFRVDLLQQVRIDCVIVKLFSNVKVEVKCIGVCYRWIIIDFFVEDIRCKTIV